MLAPTTLTPNGPTFSRLVAGVMTWGKWGHQMSTSRMQEMIEHCLELGITTFDHADIYGEYTTEAEFGEVLKAQPGLRERMQLISKCGIKLVTANRPHHRIKSYDTSREHILWSVEQSLTNLQTDYLDLLLIHRPSPLMDPRELAAVFTGLKQSGKVRYFGVSNFSARQFAMLHRHFPLVTNQIEASALQLNPFLDGTLDQALELDWHPMAWSPLGGALMFQPKPNPRVSSIRSVAENLAAIRAGGSPDQILLAWLLRHPSGVLPVLGSGRKERLSRCARALEIQLTREEWFELWQASNGKEVP